MNKSAPQNRTAYPQHSFPHGGGKVCIEPKPVPIASELAEIVTPYLVQLLQAHPVHGAATLHIHFRDSQISFFRVEPSASIILECPACELSE